MKKKKAAKKIGIIVVMVCLFTAMLSTALIAGAVEGGYASFRVSGRDSKDTGAIVNNAGNNPYYWVWAKPPTFRDKIVHQSIMHNSNHIDRSDVLMTYEGTTHQAKTSAELYYYYHINVKRQYEYDDYATVSGTWGWIY